MRRYTYVLNTAYRSVYVQLHLGEMRRAAETLFFHEHLLHLADTAA